VIIGRAGSGEGGVGRFKANTVNWVDAERGLGDRGGGGEGVERDLHDDNFNPQRSGAGAWIGRGQVLSCTCVCVCVCVSGINFR
jgi:hypothetical protein